MGDFPRKKNRNNIDTLMQLTLDKNGAQPSCREGLFHVRYGGPNAAEQGEQSLSPAKIDNSSLHPATKITHEAVMLALAHEIEILFIDGRGFPAGRIWSSRYGSISTIRKNQVQFGQSPDAVAWIRGIILWIKGIILRKVESTTAVLSMLRGAL